MATTLITGATGFIGSHLARALAARGDELRLLIRTENPAEHLSDLEFERANGDITDRRAVRRAMKGVSRVFHVAGITTMRAGSARRVYEVNIQGTKLVAEEALEAGVERLVHTSSAVALGPATRGGRADESQTFVRGSFGIPYVRSKHEAETELLRVAAHGLDAVIVNPTFVIGPDDPSGTSMALIKRFLLRRIPAYVDGGLNISDVRDVAEGHLLADSKGASGERYILGNRNFTLQRLFADLSRISGVPAPTLKLPPDLAVAGATWVERLGLPVPISADETRSASLWWTYSPAKAKRELGFSPRGHEETLQDAIEWQAEQLGDRLRSDPPLPERALQTTGRLVGAASRLIP